MSDFLDYNKALLSERLLIDTTKQQRASGQSGNLNQNIEIFLRNLIPYSVGQGINNVSGIVDQFSQGDVLSGTINSVSTILNLGSAFKTFTPAELIKYAAINFYLAPLSQMREFAIKKSAFSIRNGIAKEFDIDDHFSQRIDLNAPVSSLDQAKRRDQGGKRKDQGLIKIIKEYGSEVRRGIADIRREQVLQNLGYIYVTPIGSGGELASFKIPFQFLPNIQENAIRAKYKQQEIISRIGPIMQFVGTESLSLSINLKYHILNDRKFEANFASENWMDYYTENNVDAIETALRSLVLPNYTSDNPNGSGYEFTGTKLLPPPHVKIILGTGSMDVVEDSETTPYQALTTTYLQNIESPIIVRRMFIVESVNIKKDLERTPLYIRTTQSGKKYYNTHGFEASLNLIEITPNYLSLMPDYYVTLSKAQAKVSSSDMAGLGIFDNEQDAQRFRNDRSLQARRAKEENSQRTANDQDSGVRIRQSINALNDLTNISNSRVDEIIKEFELQSTIQNSIGGF